MARSPVRKPLCANVDGFGLHAARTVAAHDRARLERSSKGEETFPGTYNASAHLIGLSFGYRWVKKKK